MLLHWLVYEFVAICMAIRIHGQGHGCNGFDQHYEIFVCFLLQSKHVQHNWKLVCVLPCMFVSSPACLS